MISAGTARRELLDPALEARALNLEQSALIANDTADADCVVDFIGMLRTERSLSTRERIDFARLVRTLHGSNAREGLFERSVAGAADSLVRGLRDLELNSAGEAALAGKQIARRLRGPLGVLAAADRVDRRVIDALRDVDRVCRRVPTLQMLSPTVRREIGDHRFDLLCELVGRPNPLQRRDADGSGPPATQHPEGGRGHARE